MIENSHKYSPEQILDLWEYKSDDVSNMYLSENRCDMLEHLFSLFKADGYTYDDVKMYRKRVCDYLITPTGLKNTRKKGHKHEGWYENNEKDFDRVLASIFIKESDLEDNFYGNQFLPRNENFIKFLKDELGEVDESLVKEAHRHMSVFIVQYVDKKLMK